MPEPQRTDFGGTLREARVRAGLNLGDIAERTKISLASLQAIERNQLSRLPGGVFTRAFVRAYAEEVGLDPEETVSRFLDRFPEAAPEALAEPGEQAAPEPRSRTFASTLAVFCLVPVLAIAYLVVSDRDLGSWWRSGQSSPAQAAADVVAGEPAVAVPQPAVQPASSEVPTGVEPLAPPAEDAAVTATDTATPPPAGTAAPVPEGVMRLAVAPTSPCWLLLQSDGRTVFSGVLGEGERREFDLRGEVLLKAGDAAALAFTVNGQPGKPLGAAGRVVTARFNLATVGELLVSR